MDGRSDERMICSKVGWSIGILIEAVAYETDPQAIFRCVSFNGNRRQLHVDAVSYLLSPATFLGVAMLFAIFTGPYTFRVNLA